MECWLRCRVHAFEHFHGIPALAVPDNTKTGVSKAHRYDPDLNPTYYKFVWVRPDSDAARAYVKAIREIGPEHCVLSSDLGQVGNPLHPDGLLRLYQYLKGQDFSEAEIDQMSKVNAARLLGLQP